MLRIRQIFKWFIKKINDEKRDNMIELIVNATQRR